MDVHACTNRKCESHCLPHCAHGVSTNSYVWAGVKKTRHLGEKKKTQMCSPPKCKQKEAYFVSFAIGPQNGFAQPSHAFASESRCHEAGPIKPTPSCRQYSQIRTMSWMPICGIFARNLVHSSQKTFPQ